MLALSSAILGFDITPRLSGTHTGCDKTNDVEGALVKKDEAASYASVDFVWFTCSTEVACSHDLRPALKFLAEVFWNMLGKRHVRDVRRMTHACLSLFPSKPDLNPGRIVWDAKRTKPSIESVNLTQQ